MAVVSSEQAEQAVLDEYTKKYGTHQELFRKYSEVIPGGCSRSIGVWKPFPVFVSKGQGCWTLTTGDNQRVLDALSGYGPNVLGHNHPKIVQAVQEAAVNGVQFSSTTEHQYELAVMIKERVPSMELVRFACSGLEASLMCLRAARVYTGKQRFLCFEGGFHGIHDLVASNSFLNLVSSVKITAPYNDAAKVREVIAANAAELSAVIVEPFLGAGGVVPAEPEFLQAIREETEKRGIVMILDEVLSFAASYGGAQELYHIKPDLTMLGKVIGGGYPISAFGGKASIMRMFDPFTEKPLYHSGTFIGHECALVAGKAALQELTPEVLRHLSASTAAAAAEMERDIKQLGLEDKVQVTHFGNTIRVHFTTRKIIKNSADVESGNHHACDFFHLAMWNEGVRVMPRGMIVLSAVMSSEDFGVLNVAVRKSLTKIAPIIQAHVK